MSEWLTRSSRRDETNDKLAKLFEGVVKDPLYIH
jgi:hypothetical protein